MDALTARETRSLARCEQTISRGLATFRDVGAALMEIRDGRLYRDTYETFESYCRARWEMSKTHANRLIGAAAVAAVVAPIGVKPATESQVRPLLSVPEDQRADVWQEAVETAPVGDDGKPHVTAKHVEEAVRRHRGEPEKVRPTSLVVCRCCGHAVVLDADGDCPNCMEPQAPMVEKGTPLEESPAWIGLVERLAREAIEIEGRPAVAERLQRLQRLASQILMG